MNLLQNYRQWVSRAASSLVVLATLTLSLTGTAQAACGSTYAVRRGDTLMGIANLCGVTLASLEQANPQIADPSLIFPGEQINLPGGGLIPITGEGPGLTVTPASGQPGTSVTLAGSAFPAGSLLFVTIAEAEKSPVCFNAVSSDTNGNFSLPVQIPNASAASGIWVIQVDSQSSPGTSASVDFTVVMPAPAGVYTIQSGDTLSAIAARFGTTPTALRTANPDITDPNQIAPGRQILIPGSVVTINGQTVYIVKAGDALTQIALGHGTTVAALEQVTRRSRRPTLSLPGSIFSSQEVGSFQLLVWNPR